LGFFVIYRDKIGIGRGGQQELETSKEKRTIKQRGKRGDLGEEEDPNNQKGAMGNLKN